MRSLQEKLRSPKRHRLLEKDVKNRRGLCFVCGPTTLRNHGRRNGEPILQCINTTNQRNRIEQERERIRARLLILQDFKCAVCQRSGVPLILDHSHITGRVRGLLCHSCNGQIGPLFDVPELLLRAIEYTRIEGTEEMPMYPTRLALRHRIRTVEDTRRLYGKLPNPSRDYGKKRAP